MSRKRGRGRKLRLPFRQNRLQPRRTADWTRRYHQQPDELADARRCEAVRAKGELSRKRTVIVGQDDAPLVDEALWRPGTVTSVLGPLCRVDDRQGRNWDCLTRRLLRTLLIQQRAPIAVGDRVWFSDHSARHDGQRVGVIERVAPRQTRLSRRDARGREHTLVANADQLLIVASIARPRLKPHLLDRYIVAATKGALRPLLCFNKVDLLAGAPDLTDEQLDPGSASVEELIAEYGRLGYRCLRTSALTGRGLTELRAELPGHLTVLSGQSGVGKSSLLNALQPGLNLPVAEVSAESEKGRHVTSHARLLRLDFGGYVVDTPGIRQFDLWAVAPGELERCFVEFVPFVQQCRFSDCTHRQEEGCAVVAAVAAGSISPRRHRSYLKMLKEV